LASIDIVNLQVVLILGYSYMTYLNILELYLRILNKMILKYFDKGNKSMKEKTQKQTNIYYKNNNVYVKYSNN